VGPYVFVSAPFEDSEFFDFVRSVVNETTSLRCEDGRIAASQDLRAHVLGLIDHAEFVVADLTAMNRNVLYESGYAAGIQKPTLLCVKRDVEIPSDLVGLKQIPYVHRDDRFRDDLGEHLRWIVAQADLGLLRSMLEAPNPQPVYIVTSPRYPKTGTPSTTQYQDTRTFGDNLGVLGLISDFASLWGPGRGVELISAKYGPDNLLSRDLNLCLIGSPRVNPYVERALETMQSSAKRWVFVPLQVKTASSDKTRMVLYDTRWAKRTPLLGEKLLTSRERKDGWRADYGLLVRGPHPWAPGRIITIMAGGRSTGSGAACLASTQPELIRKLRSTYPQINLEDKTQTFWALVSGKFRDPDRLLHWADVTIEDAGVIAKAAAARTAR
jgi:hypothetical protein